jgi:exodeoxyribonuclease-3
MKVATFNVNSVRVRLPIILDWLKKNSPDALCLQETKVPDAKFPWKEIEAAGYHAAFRGQKGYNGVAIVCKDPPENVRIGFDEDESEGPRLIRAEVKGITIVNTYIPQGYQPLSEQFRGKLDWFKRLLAYFRRNFKPSEPLVWVGDFNVAPEAIDVYDPEFLAGHVGFHPDEQAALRKIKEWGFVDVFRKHHPEPEQYTFYDYQIRNAVKNRLGWRIDHIWATRPMANKSKDAWIDLEPRLRDKPSDHTVLVAEFNGQG